MDAVPDRSREVPLDGVLIKGVRYHCMQCPIEVGRYHWMVY